MKEYSFRIIVLSFLLFLTINSNVFAATTVNVYGFSNFSSSVECVSPNVKSCSGLSSNYPYYVTFTINVPSDTILSFNITQTFSDTIYAWFSDGTTASMGVSGSGLKKYTVPSGKQVKGLYIALHSGNYITDVSNVSYDIAPPSTPTGLKGNSGDKQVVLTWSAVAGATGYNIYQDGVKIAGPITGTTYTVKNLTNGKSYKFEVSAVNSGGESAKSSVNVIPLGPLPTAPTNLVGTPGNQQVKLTWDTVSDATSYTVYKDGLKLITVSSTTYTVTGLLNGNNYSFQVTAVNPTGESIKSNTVNVTPTGPPPPPAAPTGLTGTAGNQTISLSWNSVLGATGYNVYQDGVKITGVPLSGTSYTVTGLTNGKTYIFEVTAVNADGESPKSAALNITPVIPPPPPSPNGLAGSAGDKTAELSWNSVVGATGYNVYRDGVKITSSPIAMTTYTVTGLTNGKVYKFEVTAVNTDGESTKSNALYLTPQAAPMPPVAPIGLYGIAGNTKATLNWNADGGATGYNVYQDGVKIAGPITATTYNLTGLTNFKTYRFEVTAINAIGESEKSYVDVMPKNPPPPPPPTELEGTAGDAKATLMWNSGSNSFNVYKDDIKITSSPISAKTIVVMGLTNDIEYKFQVTAIDVNGESPKSAAIKVTPTSIPQPPPPPTDLSYKPLDGSATLTWTAVTGATEYYIYRNGVKIANVNSTSFTDSGLVNDARYNYEVSAVNDVGESRRSFIIVTPFKVVDFSDTVLPLTVTGLLKTAVNFLSLYGQWVLLVLGVIFAPVIYTVAQRLVTYAADRNWWMKKG